MQKITYLIIWFDVCWEFFYEDMMHELNAMA